MTMLAPAVVAAALWIALRPSAFCWRIDDLAQPTDAGSPASKRSAAGAVHVRAPAGRSIHDPTPGAAVVPRRSGVPGRTGTGDVASCAEMLAVAVAAGCPIAEAVTTVGETDGSGAVLAAQASALRRGQPLDEVLDTLARRPGGGWHSLASLLALSATSGAPAADALRRLGAQERTRLRRRREQRARRLPVVLLLPLAGLVLPAFVLVTIVPFGLAGGASLDLPPVNDQPVTTTEEP